MTMWPVPDRHSPLAGGPCTSGVYALAVEACRPVDDEVLARRDVVAHEKVEHALRGRGVAGAHPAQGAVPRVHRRLRELVGVHLPQALVPLDRLLVTAAALLEL